jgi:hypothetical protein
VDEAGVARASRPAETVAVEAPEVRYAKSGDVSIAYSVVGDAPIDLVFVNGWIFSALELAWDGRPLSSSEDSLPSRD